MTEINAIPGERQHAPGGPSERLTIIDSLRGFALGGVFFSNVHVWFSGRIFLPSAKQKELLSFPFNAAIDWVERYLSGGKFIAIFSFLFGLGLAVQFERAEKRGQSAAYFYARRGSTMLLFAAIHLFLLWFGDILHLYAMAGFVVLLFLRRAPNTILAWGAGLTLFSGPCMKWFSTLVPPLLTSPGEWAQRAAERTALSTQTNAWMLSAFEHGSWAEIIRANAGGYWVRFVDLAAVGFFFEVLGRILVGFYVGRIGLFNNITTNLRTFHRLLVGGLVIGVSAEILRYSLEKLKLDQASHGLGLLLPGFLRVLGQLHTTGLAAFYMAAISLLATRPWWRGKVALFAPAGRMAITNYLSQSVLAIIVFYGIGFGAIGNIGPLTTLWLPLGIFALQIAWSHVWLRHFRFGPVEWVWRSLTYGAKQSMRHEKRDFDSPTRTVI